MGYKDSLRIAGKAEIVNEDFDRNYSFLIYETDLNPLDRITKNQRENAAL